MARPIKITSVDDKRLEIFRSLKGRHLEHEGVFIAEGERVVRMLLRSGMAVQSVLINPRTYRRLRKILPQRKTEIFITDDKVFEGIVGFRYHQGLIACAPFPERVSSDDRADIFRKRHIILALDGIQDAQNVGLMVRSAAAFGVDAVLVDGTSCDPYYRQAVRVSMGGVFTIPVLYEEDLAASLKEIKKRHRTHIVVTALGNKKRRMLEKTDLSGNLCLVMGNEDSGVRRGIIDIADTVTEIPMTKRVDSLNVACACSVVLWELVRCR